MPGRLPTPTLTYRLEFDPPESPALSFNGWASVAEVIAENVRDEQRNFIGTTRLVANLLSFHTLVTMTRALQRLLQEGGTVNMDALSTLSPYRTEHINRFGNYVIDFNRLPEPLEQHPGLSLSPVSA